MSSINITFPFENSEDGTYVKMSKTTSEALRSDLLHLLLTDKGTRLYLPDFGTNLRQFLFNPNDNQTLYDIKSEINETLQKYLPKINITELSVTQNQESEKRVDVRIYYKVTDGMFSETNDLLVVM